MTVKRTRLCYWIERPAKPGVQSSNSSRVRFTVISHTPTRSRFYHTHIMYKRSWDDLCLVDLIYTLLYIFFKFAICFIVFMNLCEAYHLKRRATWWWCGGRCCCYVVAIVAVCSSIMTSRRLNTYCDDIQYMNYKTWNPQGRFTNIILTPSKQLGVCDKIHHRHHYNDVIMSAIASHTTGVSSVYSVVVSGTDQRKHHSSAPLAFVGKFTGDRTKGQ